jgi:hypothetical protein
LNSTDQIIGAYCWFGNSSVASPYYGAYAAASFLAESSYISALDDGSTAYGGYVSYASDKAASRVLLYNSDYYTGSGTRASENFILTGLTANSITAKRLTAAAATSQQSTGGTPTFGGQHFLNETCVIAGEETLETFTVTSGQAEVTLAASEALLIYL